ncbi:XdhC family protein [Nocardioides cheoyonin]|uniref:XdhC family protein n=1 Tax=Nocardioides cheoyonin TaxID=3156615 RepID=UPI0032B479F7
MSAYDAEGWSVLERARELAEAGEAVALATVVWRQGPSSGHQGSRAIVTAEGRVEGWIGGACAEPVVLREARDVIGSGEPRLLYLGTGSGDEPTVPEGATYVSMSCQSEGALQIFVEPVLPVTDLVVVGRTPMVATLADLAAAIGWRARAVDTPDLPSTPLARHSIVVVATQGHDDEDAVRWALESLPDGPAFVGLVASRKRGDAVLGYLADRGVDPELLRRVHNPVGLDLGHTTHAEIAVAVLAQLVQLRAAGALRPATGPSRTEEALDPVCHMSVPADDSHWPLERDGSTYYFCCPGCHDRFAEDPTAYLVPTGSTTEE